MLRRSGRGVSGCPSSCLCRDVVDDDEDEDEYDGPPPRPITTVPTGSYL
ncbi:hypothetical protein [Streptomyces sp. NPDC001415]